MKWNRLFRRTVILPRLGMILLAMTQAACSSSGDDDDSSATPTATPTPTSAPTPTPSPTPEPTPVDWIDHTTRLMDFWTKSNQDTTYGGYYTYVTQSGTVKQPYKWTRMLSREIYGYSKAFQLTGDVTYLERAKSGVDFLTTYAWDPEHGGFRLELNADGSLLKDGRDLFSLNYALTGLVAYLEVTQDPDVLRLVNDSYDLLNQAATPGTDGVPATTGAWDQDWGGYYKALDIDMTVMDDGKDFNALVDTATAYLFNLYEITADNTRRGAYKERLDAIGKTIVSHMLHVDSTGWIGENFTREWVYDYQNGDFGGKDITLCGHNLKVVWTLMRLSYIPDTFSTYQSDAQTLLDFLLPTCRDKQYGGIFDEVNRQTSTLVNTYKSWWQQEQGMVANQLMWATTKKSFYADVAGETRRFYLDHFVDQKYGEVFTSVKADGTASDTTKGNEWKSAYHSTETAYMGHLYDSLLVNKAPVTLYYHFEETLADRTLRLSPTELPYGTYEIDDPVTLDGASLALDTPSTVTIPAGSRGTLKVIYRP